jgi:hypothetical protein
MHPKLCPHCWILPSRVSGFGGKGIRTPDFQLAKLALYQLSYAPTGIAECRFRISIAEFRLQGNKSKMPDVEREIDIRHSLFRLSLFIGKQAQPNTRLIRP